MRTQCRLRPVPCAENTPEFPRARVPVRACACPCARAHACIRMIVCACVCACVCARVRVARLCVSHARWSAAVLSAALTAGPDGHRAVPGAGGSQTWTTPFMFALVDTRAITSPANALYLRSGPPHTPACLPCAVDSCVIRCRVCCCRMSYVLRSTAAVRAAPTAGTVLYRGRPSTSRPPIPP